MMRALWEQKGATLSVNIVTDPRAIDFIDAHADTLSSSFTQVQMSERMRARLERSTWIFSGMKAIREMGEAFPSLLDENGERKPFERFLNDVRKVDQTYNQHYLRAEYEFAAASAQMAAKWERFAEDGDRYNLQYRTAGDDRVRPEHAALDGITLPPSDSFWESYFPPNGWRCRCDVVQVRKSKYPTTPHDEAMQLGELATQKDTKNIFRFNPGKQERVFPACNPYTSSKCNGCELGAKQSLAKSDIPVGKKCQACRLLNRKWDEKDKPFDMGEAIKRLQEVSGSEFVSSLKQITQSRQFKPLEDGIWIVGTKEEREKDQDWGNLHSCAQKAVLHGYEVFMLPNPRKTKSADYIMVRKGLYKLADLKSVEGQNSVGARLSASAGQANRAVLNMTTTYNPRRLAIAIKHYFENNANAIEVIIFKGKREISIKRDDIKPRFIVGFIRQYSQ